MDGRMGFCTDWIGDVGIAVAALLLWMIVMAGAVVSCVCLRIRRDERRYADAAQEEGEEVTCEET